MLINASHKRWIIITSGVALAALVLYGWLYWRSLDGLTGGSTAGLWYGVAGSALMIFAGLLAAHRRLARWPLIPSRAWLLKGHIWLGLLSFVFILCHSGFRWGGTLEQMLWLIFVLILLSGILGLALQNVLPAMLTAQVPQETPYGQMPHVYGLLRSKADALVEGLNGSPAAGLQDDVALARQELHAFYDSQVRPFLSGKVPGSFPLANAVHADMLFASLQGRPDLAPVRAQLRELEDLCAQRRQIAWQERLHRWLHSWLLIHVPLSVALLVLGLAHVIMSLYY